MKIQSFPNIVHIKTASSCNLRCVHCPRTIMHKKKLLPLVNMSFDNYKKIVDETSYFNGNLRIVNDGEPLIHKDIINQIKYAKQSSLRSWSINTNGVFLDRVVSSLIEPSKVPFIIEISLDALLKRTYDRVRNQIILRS